jgi:small subunit ribosomal protein S20
MANTAQSRKRARQNTKTSIRNKSRISQMRTSIKNTAVTAAEKGEKKENTAKCFSKTASMIDKNANKKLIHKNKAARLKSRLNKRIKKLPAAK